jgi:hypothetical protein
MQAPWCFILKCLLLVNPLCFAFVLVSLWLPSHLNDVSFCEYKVEKAISEVFGGLLWCIKCMSYVSRPTISQVQLQTRVTPIELTKPCSSELLLVTIVG